MDGFVGPIFENLIAGLLGSTILSPVASSSAAIASGGACGAAISRTMTSIRSSSTATTSRSSIWPASAPVSDTSCVTPTAARQLIFIGEQNEVRHQLDRDALVRYEQLFMQYDGERVVEDNNEFLENCKRIARLVGRTVRDMGIEVLLHNLANPAKSICAIEGGAVTGRALELGTTSLVIDLKKRKLLNQDKLNYELVIGARRFKCTTIPIYRREFGLIAALCINIDVNYIRDEVKSSPERIDEFLAKYARTEVQLEENILSREEYAQAVTGKRHWRDERAGGTGQGGSN